MAVSVDGAVHGWCVSATVCSQSSYQMTMKNSWFLVSCYADAGILVLEKYCYLAVCSFVASVQALRFNTCQSFSC